MAFKHNAAYGFKIKEHPQYRGTKRSPDIIKTKPYKKYIQPIANRRI